MPLRKRKNPASKSNCKSRAPARKKQKTSCQMMWIIKQPLKKGVGTIWIPCNEGDSGAVSEKKRRCYSHKAVWVMRKEDPDPKSKSFCLIRCSDQDDGAKQVASYVASSRKGVFVTQHENGILKRTSLSTKKVPYYIYYIHKPSLLTSENQNERVLPFYKVISEKSNAEIENLLKIFGEIEGNDNMLADNHHNFFNQLMDLPIMSDDPRLSFPEQQNTVFFEEDIVDPQLFLHSLNANAAFFQAESADDPESSFTATPALG